MSDENAGTGAGGEEAQGAAAGAAAAAGTPAVDEVTTLRSRASGLDAKVTKLLAENAAEKARADAAEARALELAQAKEGGDEELRKAITKLEKERDQAKLEATIGTRAAQYPETFGVFGPGIATMTEDALAAAEARFQGVAAAAAPAAPARPIGNNQSRDQGAQGAPLTAKERYDAKVKAFSATPIPWEQHD